MVRMGVSCRGHVRALRASREGCLESPVERGVAGLAVSEGQADPSEGVEELFQDSEGLKGKLCMR